METVSWVFVTVPASIISLESRRAIWKCDKAGRWLPESLRTGLKRGPRWWMLEGRLPLERDWTSLWRWWCLDTRLYCRVLSYAVPLRMFRTRRWFCSRNNTSPVNVSSRVCLNCDKCSSILTENSIVYHLGTERHLSLDLRQVWKMSIIFKQRWYM